MTRPRLAALATATLAALTLSACASAQDDTTTTPAGNASAAAASDNSFTLYSGRDQELIEPLIEQFESATGVNVDVRYAGTTELAALLQEEGDATPADVFLAQDAGALGAPRR